MPHVAEISFWSHNSPSSYYIMIYLSIPILLLLSISVFLNFIVYIKLGTLRCITETSTAPNENYFHFYLNCSFVSVFCLSCISVLRWNRISSNPSAVQNLSEGFGGWWVKLVPISPESTNKASLLGCVVPSSFSHLLGCFLQFLLNSCPSFLLYPTPLYKVIIMYSWFYSTINTQIKYSTSSF